MRSYTVEWDETAIDLLAALFLQVGDPDILWPAQYRADRLLEQNPAAHGVELSEGLWQMIEPPLKIFYEIRDDQRLVLVTHVQLA